MNNFNQALDSLRLASDLEIDTREYILRWFNTSQRKLRTRPAMSRSRNSDPRVWSYWDSSEIGKPEIISLCAESQIAAFGSKMKILSPKDLPQFVQNRSVLEAQDRYEISKTQFSDLLRLSLLESHGGLWLDATAFITRTPDTRLFDSGLFLFLRPNDPFRISSWCIYSRPQNYLIRLWLKALLKFWHDHGELIHYFQMHFIFEAMVLLDPEANQHAMSFPAHSALRPHLVQSHLRICSGDHLAPVRTMLESTWIHKLTFKNLPPKPTDLIAAMSTHLRAS